MRLVWRFKAATSGGPGAQEVLDQLEQRFRFWRKPRPVSEGSACYQAVPITRKTGRRILAFLADPSQCVESAVLETGVRPPLTREPVGSAPGSLTALGWQGTSISGDTRSVDWRGHQIYLKDAAHGGIDAHHAWTYAGGRGEGVRLVDVERGCDTKHEDLRRPLGGLLVPNHSHGTETLGVCCGDPDNDFGVIGIAHRASVDLAPVKKEWLKQYARVAEIVEKVGESLSAGDVLLFELEATFDRLSIPSVVKASLSLPLELAPDIRDAIDGLAGRGVYAIEPAGNGGHDLDRFGLDTKTGSSAIMVGAGHPFSRDRLQRSNYGSRVDVQGLGLAVVTTGKKGTLQNHPDPRRRYSQSFNGTSSASAIVAGAVACLSGILKAHGITNYSPEAMRRLLRRTGTPQGGDTSKRIGPLPNLRRAIRRLERETGTKFRQVQGT